LFVRVVETGKRAMMLSISAARVYRQPEYTELVIGIE